MATTANDDEAIKEMEKQQKLLLEEKDDDAAKEMEKEQRLLLDQTANAVVKEIEKEQKLMLDQNNNDAIMRQHQEGKKGQEEDNDDMAAAAPAATTRAEKKGLITRTTTIGCEPLDPLPRSVVTTSIKRPPTTRTTNAKDIEKHLRSTQDGGVVVASPETSNPNGDDDMMDVMVASAEALEENILNKKEDKEKSPTTAEDREVQELYLAKLRGQQDHNIMTIGGTGSTAAAAAAAATSTSSATTTTRVRQQRTPGAFAVLGIGRAISGHSTIDIGSSNDSNHDDNPNNSAGTQLVATSTTTAPISAILAVSEELQPAEQQETQGRTTTEQAMEEGASGGGGGGGVGVIEGEAVQVVEKERQRCLIAGLVITTLVATIVLMALGLAGVFETNSNGSIVTDNESINTTTLAPTTLVEPSTASPSDATDAASTTTTTTVTKKLPTLERIRQRGVLGCTKIPFENPPKQFTDEDGELDGYFIAMCEAVAAAALGNKSLVQYHTITSFRHMFDELAHNDSIDIINLGLTPSMERWVNESTSGVGSTFTMSFEYDGLALGGDPFYMDCASNDMKNYNECRGISVCAIDSSGRFAKLISARQLVVTSGAEDNFANFLNGTCNLMAGSYRYLANQAKDTLYERGYTGNYTVGNFTMSKGGEAMAVASDDPVFSDFVNVVVDALFVAEAHNITQETAYKFPETTVFGEEYRHMFQHAIEANGNYGEIHDRILGPYGSLRNLNRINDGSSGLLSSGVIGGSASNDRPGTPLGPTLQSILDRGLLRCAVTAQQGSGFSALSSLNNTWAGANVDYCKAVAAAIFRDGRGDSIEYVEINEATDGYALLATDQVDVLAGATWTLETDVKEQTTQQGYAFSQPYFYGFSDAQDNLCLATQQEDHQWVNFVKWTVDSIIYAEENEISQRTFFDMPEVNLFGNQFARMFRSAIQAVGNSGEIYERNLAQQIPRSGRNLINKGPHYGPQVYPLPGMI